MPASRNIGRDRQLGFLEVKKLARSFRILFEIHHYIIADSLALAKVNLIREVKKANF